MLNADGLRMYTPYVIRGNGHPDGTAPSGFVALIGPVFYAQSCFNFQILCFAWTGAAIFWFLSV